MHFRMKTYYDASDSTPDDAIRRGDTEIIRNNSINTSNYAPKCRTRYKHLDTIPGPLVQLVLQALGGTTTTTGKSPCRTIRQINQT